MKKKISQLKVHPQNKILYGDTEPDQVTDLAENIEVYGQITPVVINKSGIILSGHRRIAALKLLGRTYVECTVQDIPTADEPFYLIAANKQRQKNMVQVSNEIELLYSLYGKGQGFRSDLNSNLGLTRPKSARTQIASELGISHQTVNHLRYIRKHRPDVLPYIGVSITLAAAASQVKLFENQKKILQDKSKKNDDISLSGFNFQLFTKSSANMSELESVSIDAVITSPPYFQMRQFTSTGTNGDQTELGQEDTIEEYIDNLMEVMTEVKRVMKPTASMMLNIGDSYHNGGLLGIPAQVSIALADRLGLICKQQLIWWKNTSSMPEAAKKRRHTDFEPIFHFVKNASKYFYDMDAIRIPYVGNDPADRKPPRHIKKIEKSVNARWVKRNVGEKPTDPVVVNNISSSIHHPAGKPPGCILEVSRAATGGAIDNSEIIHTAQYPVQLVRELLKPIVHPGFIVLDPFSGAATTGVAAFEFGCSYVGYDTNAGFQRQAAKRLRVLNE